MRPLAMKEPCDMSENEQIALVAYRIYEAEGRQDGQQADHWARAERIVHEQRMGLHEVGRQGGCAESLEPPSEMVP